FSFLRLGMMSPCCVVATTSRVTIGTSTAIVTPAWGGCCAGLAALGVSGFCCCCAGGGAPPCGPVGAWAKAEFSALRAGGSLGKGGILRQRQDQSRRQNSDQNRVKNGL